MKYFKQSVASISLAVLLAAVLLVGSSFIPRQGNSLTYIEGQDSHRDVRGMPFVFLKRSVGDGQCDVQDLQSGKCSMDLGNEPHQLLISRLAIDAGFWFLVTLAITTLLLRKHKE